MFGVTKKELIKGLENLKIVEDELKRRLHGRDTI